MRCMNMMRVFFIGLVVLAFFYACEETPGEHVASPRQKETAMRKAEPESFLGFRLDRFRVVKDTVEKNETFGKLLISKGFSPAEVYDLVQSVQGNFDVRKIRAGKPYYWVYETDKSDSVDVKPYAFIYEESPVDYKLLYLEPDSSDQFYEEIHKPVTTVDKKLGLKIDKSLFLDLQECGISPVLALKLSDIYAWTVDFFHLYPGDGFKVLYEDKYVDSTYLGVGEIKAAVFYHRGDKIYAFKYYDSIHDSYEYFDEKGRNLRKQFLKSPLKFGRITSRYSMRRYVRIYGRVKPHLGTDFAAPVGTPIYATADGVVEKAGYTRGNGNYVKIRHNSTYATQYLHMRNFAKGIRPGVRVKQGQVIGYVGMTGFTTGPHVCYRFWKNGRQVDPLKEKMPEAKALDSSLLPSYFQFIDSLKNQLDKDIHL